MTHCPCQLFQIYLLPFHWAPASLDYFLLFISTILMYTRPFPLLFLPSKPFSPDLCLSRSSCISGISSSVTSFLTTQSKLLYHLHFLVCYSLRFYIICDTSVWNYLSYLSVIYFCSPLSRKQRQRSGSCAGAGGPRGASPRSRSGGADVRRYPSSKVRSSGCALLEQPWRYPMSKVRETQVRR